jgi:glutathione S-transferase
LQDGQLYVAGDKLSHGDLALYCALSGLKSGFMDGECLPPFLCACNPCSCCALRRMFLVLASSLRDVYMCPCTAGFPTTYLDDYPILKDYRNHIASIDFVKQYFADAEGLAAAYKPDA